MLALEHRFTLDGPGSDALQLRVSGGFGTAPGDSFDLAAYADAGVTGAERRDLFAGGQVRAAYRLSSSLSVGAGAWGGWQDGGGAAGGLVEAGPAVRLGTATGRASLTAEISYRLRVEGEGGRSSGPALLIAASF